MVSGKLSGRKRHKSAKNCEALEENHIRESASGRFRKVIGIGANPLERQLLKERSFVRTAGEIRQKVTGFQPKNRRSAGTIRTSAFDPKLPKLTA